MTARLVHLAIDLGELDHEPPELCELATLAAVACGGHAGDAASMKRAITGARGAGALLFAHPSYPDRAGFGRRSLSLGPTALLETLREQLEAFCEAAAAEGAVVRGVKPHGALYHDAESDPERADALLEAARRVLGRGAVLLGRAGGGLVARAREKGWEAWGEAFADRATLPDGSLVPRGTPGALLTEPSEAAHQALVLATSPEVRALCVHSDTRGAVSIARAVRRALAEAGLCPPAASP
jgi:UPF0271 protein